MNALVENFSPTVKLEFALRTLAQESTHLETDDDLLAPDTGERTRPQLRWAAGPRGLVHFGLGGVLTDRDNAHVKVEVSRAVGRVSVIDVMPFSVEHLDIDARDLTVRLMNRVLDFLCQELTDIGQQAMELRLPKSEIKRRVELESGVKAGLRRLGFARMTALEMMKGLRFAEFKSPSVLFISHPNLDMESRRELSGLLAPVAVSAVPVVVADIESYEPGQAGGFSIFADCGLATDLPRLKRIIGLLEDELLQAHYRHPQPDATSSAAKPSPTRLPPAKVFEEPRLSLPSAPKQQETIPDGPPRRISDEEAMALEADLRARGLLL